MSGVVVRLLTPAEVARRTDEFVDLYRKVYAEPPYHEGEEQVAGFVERFAVESGDPGFTVVAARTVAEGWSDTRTGSRSTRTSGGTTPTPTRPHCAAWRSS